MVVIKFQHKQDIRRVTVNEENLTFSQLQELAKNLFAPLAEPFVFQYKDDEGDQITVSSETEVQEALRLMKPQNIIRFQIISEKEDKKSCKKQWKQEKKEERRRKCEKAQESTANEQSFFDVLQNLVTDNSFVRDLLNGLEVEIKTDDITDFFKQATGASGKEEEKPKTCDQSKPLHHARCDSCNTQIRGIRYKCTSCPDYDLCETCEPKKATVHQSDHTFETIRCTRMRNHFGQPRVVPHHPHHVPHVPHVPHFPHNPYPTFPTQIPSHPRCPRWNQQFPQSEVYHHAICDGCNTRIKGIRHKCEQCPDFDLCESCETKKSTVHPDHSFRQILRPFPVWAVHSNQGNNVNINNNSNTTTESVSPKQERTEIPVTVQEVPKEDEEVKELIPLRFEPYTTTQPVVSEETKPEEKVEVVENKIEKEPEVKLSPFEAKLKQLEEMGFVNKQRNIETLVKTQGDMLESVKLLLE